MTPPANWGAADERSYVERREPPNRRHSERPSGRDLRREPADDITVLTAEPKPFGYFRARAAIITQRTRGARTDASGR